MINAASHIVDMQVVVGVAHGGFTVEGDAHALTYIVAEVDAHLFAFGSAIDVVINVCRTFFVVPLAQDGPGGLIVSGNQHNKLVVGSSGCRSSKSSAVSGQSKVEV